MNRFSSLAIRFAVVVSCAPIASARWNLLNTVYVPFNTTCSQDQFQFWDAYAFIGQPQIYGWPNGNTYPCASTVDSSTNNASVARAALVSVGDLMQGSAMAQDVSGPVSAGMSGTGHYWEFYGYVGNCIPWAMIDDGSCQIAGLTSGSAVAEGVAELKTNLTGVHEARVEVSGGGFDLDEVTVPDILRITSYVYFRELTSGSLFASADGAGTLGRAEIRAEVFLRVYLWEECFPRFLGSRYWTDPGKVGGGGSK